MIALLLAMQLYFPLFQEHQENLKYLECASPPCCIMFSAMPGMGKTTLARQLEDHFEGIRISSDEGRALMKKHGFDHRDIETYLPLFIEYVLANTENRFIILDRSIDREYKRYNQIMERQGLPIFLIRLVLPKDEHKRRVMERDGHPLEYYSTYEKQYNNSTTLYPHDFLFEMSSSFNELTDSIAHA